MTRLGDKITVEPLTGDRLARVESSVLAAYRATEPVAPRRSWRIVRVAVPAMAAVAAALLLWINWPASPAPVTEAPAVEPTRVVTDSTGGSRIDLGDAVLLVGADTELEVRRESGGIDVILTEGTVDCEVEPRGQRPPFAVRAGEVDVIVVGTRFEVERHGDDVRVEVIRGKVRVDRRGASSLVAAGQVWRDGEVKLAAAEVPVAPAAAEPGDPVAEVAKTNSVKKVKRAKPRATRVEPAPKPPAKKRLVVAGGLVKEPDWPDLLDAPLDELRTLTNGGSRKAGFSKAYLEAFRHGDRRASLQTIDYFIRRFESGPYRADVMALRIVLSCDKPSTSCREAAHSYLRAYPGGEYHKEARKLINWM